MPHRITFPNGTVFETDDPDLAWKAMERAQSLAAVPARSPIPLSVTNPSPATLSPPGTLTGQRGSWVFGKDGAQFISEHDGLTVLDLGVPPRMGIHADPFARSDVISFKIRGEDDERKDFREFWQGLTDRQREVLRIIRRRGDAVPLRDLHEAVGQGELQGFAVHLTNIASKAMRHGFSEADIFVRQNVLVVMINKTYVGYAAGAKLLRYLTPKGDLP